MSVKDMHHPRGRGRPHRRGARAPLLYARAGPRPAVADPPSRSATPARRHASCSSPPNHRGTPMRALLLGACLLAASVGRAEEAEEQPRPDPALAITIGGGVFGFTDEATRRATDPVGPEFDLAILWA